MAPSKKTKSAPNQTSKNLLKAIRKHRSSSEVGKMKSTKTTTPVSIPSPEKVKKKPITKKLQNELSKKRKRVEEPVKVKKEGLRLLKRAPVSMHRIVRRKIQGIKLVVNFNSKGVPYGAAATEMQSYIGVLARTKVPISLKSWKEVSKETLKKIWNCVQIAFDVPPEAKQVILKSAGNKWREFKSKLTTHYVLPYRQQRHLIKTPPADYSFIEQRHWDIFLASRLTDDFIAVHDKQKKVREQNIYPHHMSRRGYANLEEEMSQGDPSLEIDRSDAWIRARQDKDGNFKSSEVETIAVNIEKMKKQVLDGEVTEEGSDDVMSKVLGKSDQKAGKVCGGGTLVKPSVYFHLPRQTRKGKSIDDKIQEGLQKFMSEAENRIARERDAYWEKKFEDLKSSLLGQNTNGDGSPNIGSQQGSCSKDACAYMKAVELDGVKKKLDLVEDDILKKKDKNVENEVKNVENEVKTDEIKTAENEVETDKDEVKTDEVKTAENQMKTGEDQVKTDEDQDIGNIIVELVENQDQDMANNIVKTNEVRTVDIVELVSENKLKVVNNNCGVGSATTNWCSEWKLTIESPTNVVAYGTIDNITTVLHGKPLGEDNSRVCITRVVQENEKIPYPPEDDVVTVGQAVGTYIAWPKNWIHPTKNGGAAETPKKSNQVVKKKFKRVKDCVKEKQYVIDVDVDGYPAELKQLWLWAKETLKDGRAHSFQLCKDAFGSTTKHVKFK